MVFFVDLPLDIIRLIIQYNPYRLDVCSKSGRSYDICDDFGEWKNALRFLSISQAWREAAISAVYSRLYFMFPLNDFYSSESSDDSFSVNSTDSHDYDWEHQIDRDYCVNSPTTNCDFLAQNGAKNIVTKLYIHYSEGNVYRWLGLLKDYVHKQNDFINSTELINKDYIDEAHAEGDDYTAANSKAFSAVGRMLKIAFPNVMDISFRLEPAYEEKLDACSALFDAYSDRLVNLKWWARGELPTLVAMPKLSNLSIHLHTQYDGPKSIINPEHIKRMQFSLYLTYPFWKYFSRKDTDTVVFSNLTSLHFDYQRFRSVQSSSHIGLFNPDRVKLEFPCLTSLRINGVVLLGDDAKLLMRHVHTKFYFSGSPINALVLCKNRNRDLSNVHLILDNVSYNQPEFIQETNDVFKEAQNINNFTCHIKNTSNFSNFQELVGLYTLA